MRYHRRVELCISSHYLKCDGPCEGRVGAFILIIRARSVMTARMYLMIVNFRLYEGWLSLCGRIG